jgi:hypothetical protein
MSNSFLYRKILTPRRLMIDYQAPPICEGDFTSTGVVTISLLPILRPVGPTGLVMDWNGTRWRLSWNIYPGALCYSVYRLDDVLDPFSEWTLVAECITDTSTLLPPGIYAVTVITPDGESDPSDPIEGDPVDPGDPPPVVPDPPAECDAETGVDTPCDLMISEDTDLGNLVPDPFIPTHTEYWGTFDQALYEISYQGGAWKDDANPGPGGYKILKGEWEWNGGAVSQDPFLGGGGFLGASQGAVEGAYLAACAGLSALCSRQFIHDGGTIGVRMFRFGTATNPVPGAPNPTWKLKRLGTWPTYPNHVRIAGYSESIWGGSCSTIAGGAPAWDGTLDLKSVHLPGIFTWQSSSGMGVTINGKIMVEAKVTWWQSNPKNATGCGWLLWVSFFDEGGLVDGWTGIKSVGTDPVGTYYRDSGCLTGPGCLTLESY